MSLTTLGLILLTVYLCWRFWARLSEDNVSEPEKNTPPRHKYTYVRFVHNKETNMIEEQEVSKDEVPPSFLLNEEVLETLRQKYECVCTAFVTAKKADLKKLLSKRVYDIFAAAIDRREEKKQTLDFSLIGFDTISVMQKSDTALTVRFVTEQINVLKNAKGKVVEGDPMRVARVFDIWTFAKEGPDDWIVTSTLSCEDVNAICRT